MFSNIPMGTHQLCQVIHSIWWPAFPFSSASSPSAGCAGSPRLPPSGGTPCQLIPRAWRGLRCHHQSRWWSSPVVPAFLAAIVVQVAFVFSGTSSCLGITLVLEPVSFWGSTFAFSASTLTFGSAAFVGQAKGAGCTAGVGVVFVWGRPLATGIWFTWGLTFAAGFWHIMVLPFGAGIWLIRGCPFAAGTWFLKDLTFATDAWLIKVLPFSAGVWLTRCLPFLTGVWLTKLATGVWFTITMVATGVWFTITMVAIGVWFTWGLFAAGIWFVRGLPLVVPTSISVVKILKMSFCSCLISLCLFHPDWKGRGYLLQFVGLGV